MKAYVQREDEGQVLQVLASRVTIRVRSEDTGGAFSVVEMQAPPGFRAPPVLHRHVDVDWYALVQDGEVAIDLDGVHNRIPRGGIVVVPRGVAFRWWNPSQEHGVRWLGTYTPGGFERFFIDVAAGLRRLDHPAGAADIAAIAMPLWPRYHVETVQGP